MSDKTVIINRREYPFTQDETILDICNRNGIFIPTLCHLKGTTPTGACRICVVEIEKARNLVPSCSMPAAPGMIIQTESARVIKSRKFTLALLFSTGNHNCAMRGTEHESWAKLQLDAMNYDKAQDICEVYGSCKLQEYAYKYQVKSEIFKGTPPKHDIELKNPLLIRDFSRCILCGRCVQACREIQVNNAISTGYRGNESKMVALGDAPLAESDCVYCGECQQICPVGALVEKKSRFNARMWEVEKIRTTCHYCGVGCQLDLHVKNNKIARVTGASDTKPNNGSLCVKGHFAYDFLHSKNRLTTPQIKKNGSLEPASWDEAINLISEKITEIKDKDGADAIACISSPKSTNEDMYLLQKLFKEVVGTKAVAQSEHLAMHGVFMHNTLQDFENAPIVIVAGADITEDNPVAATFIKRGTLKGNKLIVIDSRNTTISKHASLHLQPKDGTEDLVISTLVRTISGEGNEKLKPENTADTTDVLAKDISSAVEIIKAGEKVVLVYDHTAINCAEHLKHLKQLAGDNINCFSGNNNTQGACFMGLVPGYKPGLKRSQDNGTYLTDIVKNLFDNKIKLLYCAGENLAMANPGSNAFVVAQSMFTNHGSELADVVLPVAGWSEYAGTYINTQQHVSMCRKAVDAPGEAKPGWQICNELAKRLGADWKYENTQDIWDNDISKSIPTLTQVTYKDIELSPVKLNLPKDSLAEILVPAWKSATYHHKLLMEECDGLDEIKTKDTTQEITQAFLTFLKEENALDKKESLDKTLKEHKVIKGAIIPVLQIFQEIIGYLPPVVQRYIAHGLNVPPSDVYGIVSFYAFFTQIPRGEFTIKVCMGTACYVMGANEITNKFIEKLGVEVDDTTEDRMFTLETVRCIGCCGLAPAIMVNDSTHGQVSPANVEEILNTYREKSNATK